MFLQIRNYISHLQHQQMTNNNQNELDKALRNLPSPSYVNLDTMPLPIAHLTSVKSYKNIVEQGNLEAKFCKVFQKNLIYFSYGNIFHRYQSDPRNEATWLPVAFLFEPESINWINYLFPYDTGAAYKNRYKNRKVRNFERFKIKNEDSQEALASKLVYYYFSSNRQYLDGCVDVTHAQKAFMDKESVLHDLLNFLKSDLTKHRVDYRQRVIECQTKNDIPLEKVLKSLIWIGLERRYRNDFRRLYMDKKITRIPSIETYDSQTSRPPDYYTSILEDKAKEFMKNSYY